MIEPPSRAVRDYLAQFGVVAIFITRSGKRAILAAAGRLGVTLTEHTTVMRRAKAAVGELDTCLRL
jgi:hypothetical protein